MYNKRQALRAQRPSGSVDDELDEWVDEEDTIEESIGRLSAESIGDVAIKLTVLCDRLREDVSLAHRYDASSFVIAQCARDDLRRLIGGAS